MLHTLAVRLDRAQVDMCKVGLAVDEGVASLATALADLLNQESLPAFERRVRRYTDPDILILDSC